MEKSSECGPRGRPLVALQLCVLCDLSDEVVAATSVVLGVFVSVWPNLSSVEYRVHLMGVR
jgi:hypothetical protein